MILWTSLCERRSARLFVTRGSRFAQRNVYNRSLLTVHRSRALEAALSAARLFLFARNQHWQIRLLDQFANLRNFLILDLRPLFQLLFQLAVQQLEYVELRFGWLGVARVYGMAECIKSFVQHVWESEISFRSFHVHLNEPLLDFRHFVIELVGGIKRLLKTLIVAEAFM